MTTVIEVTDLHREYTISEGWFSRSRKAVKAVRGISFTVNAGEVFGLLGQNGAGKTTTIKILTTMLLPTSGSARVLGLDVVRDFAQIRPRINFVFGGEKGFYGRVSAIENLCYFADLYRIARTTQKHLLPDLLEFVGLKDRADHRVETFSKGMKQRLHIARSLLNDPEILFLDEPTIGLDPNGALELRRLIQRLAAQGKTILLTTHYMHEAEQLCRRVGIVKQGVMAAMDTPTNLKRIAQGVSVLEFRVYDLQSQHLEALRKLPGTPVVKSVAVEGGNLISVQTENPDALMPEAIRAMEGCKIASANIRQATLEDAYLRIVG